MTAKYPLIGIDGIAHNKYLYRKRSIVFFQNKSIKVIKSVIDYYEGGIDHIPYSVSDISKALDYTKKYRNDYPDDVIEKLKTVKMMLST